MTSGLRCDCGRSRFFPRLTLYELTLPATGSWLITLIVARPAFYFFLSITGFKRLGLTRKPMGIQVTRVV